MTSIPLTCIVDDDADYRLMLQLLFKRWFPHYPVRFFSGGEAFLKALPQMSQLPSLVLLDRHMPQFDGHQTLEALKKHPTYKRIPIVMMSADATRKEIESCYDSGVNSFLTKRSGFESLKQLISSIGHYWLETNEQPIES